MPTVTLETGQKLKFPEGTSEGDIHFAVDEYIKNNDIKPVDEVKTEAAKEESQGFLKTAGQFAMGLPQGLGNKFVGATQTLTSALGGSDTKFAKNLAKEVTNLKQRQSELPSAERAGITGGEIYGDLALSPTKGLGVVGQAATGGLVSGLTTPLEESGTGARLEEAGKQTATGAAFGKGLKTLGEGYQAVKGELKTAKEGLKARLPEELIDAGNAIKQKSTQLFEALKEGGSKIRPQAGSHIANEVENAIKESGKLHPKLHGDTMAIVDDLKEAVKGDKFDLTELHQYTQLLNDVVKKNTDALGKVNPDGFKAISALNKIDEVVHNLKPNYLIESGNLEAPKILDEAKKQWAQYRKFDKITNIIEKADGDSNRTKQLLKNFLSNRKNLRGFTSEEVDGLKKIALNTPGEKILKTLGKFGFDFGTSRSGGNTVLPFITGASGLPHAAPLVAVGTAGRQIQKYITNGRVEEALKIIEGNKENAAQIISSIPNRKVQEKLLNHIIKGAAITGAETLNQ